MVYLSAGFFDGFEYRGYIHVLQSFYHCLLQSLQNFIKRAFDQLQSQNAVLSYLAQPSPSIELCPIHVIAFDFIYHWMSTTGMGQIIKLATPKSLLGEDFASIINKGSIFKTSGNLEYHLQFYWFKKIYCPKCHFKKINVMLLTKWEYL